MAGFKSSRSYQKFSHSVKRERRYIRNADDEAFLQEILRTSQARIRPIKRGSGLSRAQLGHGWRSEYQDGSFMGEVPCAYPPDRMKPPPDRAAEGRANPKGISMLYLSNRKQTAISETRPWIGSLVSCAKFVLNRDVKVIDFSVYHGTGYTIFFEEPNDKEKEKAVWSDIDNAFSMPVTLDDRVADYAPTQIIAELFKKEGYDGVAYKSAFGSDGYNIALFDLDDVRLESCNLYEVKAAQFEIAAIDNPYWIAEDGKVRTLSIEFIGPAKDDGEES